MIITIYIIVGFSELSETALLSVLLLNRIVRQDVVPTYNDLLDSCSSSFAERQHRRVNDV